MPLSTDLMPIESGCEALVLSGFYAGRSVSVCCRIADDGWYVFHGQQGYVNPQYAGCWLVQMNTGKRNACVLPGDIMMRINGYRLRMQADGLDRLIGKQMRININKRTKK